jgi:osmoprotectant transport system permease protein
MTSVPEVRLVLVLVAVLVTACAPSRTSPAPLRIGSKTFTESVILGEIAVAVAQAHGAPAVHRRALGGTQIVFGALTTGEIDVYAEYTGTLTQEILRGVPEDALPSALAKRGIVMGPRLGFDDSYALGMKAERAATLGIARISDLAAHPELRFAFSNEFIDRADGWRGLRGVYQLPHRNVRGVDHEIAYRGLDAGDADVIDLYSTDPEIAEHGLTLLEDDRHHFPTYAAVWLYREELARRAPDTVASLDAVAGRISAPAMIAMNLRAKRDRVAEETIAAEFVAHELGAPASSGALRPRAPDGWLHALWRRTTEHLFLVAISLLLAIVVAIPLGIAAARRPALGRVILGITEILQTVPSLALLVFMIPLLGIGEAPAIVALFVYSLLPIVRNTHAGLRGIPPALREVATALGLTPRASLRAVELPLASPAILAGIKTSAVINVGTATLGALIGAGGYGQPILTGIRLDNLRLILEGAIPAALLALGVERIFDLVEKIVVPRGLRL